MGPFEIMLLSRYRTRLAHKLFLCFVTWSILGPPSAAPGRGGGGDGLGAGGGNPASRPGAAVGFGAAAADTGEEDEDFGEWLDLRNCYCWGI